MMVFVSAHLDDETIDASVVEWDDIPTVEERVPTMAELMAELQQRTPIE